LQLFENKNRDLAGENEEISDKFEELKAQMDFVEEENMYLKAVA